MISIKSFIKTTLLVPFWLNVRQDYPAIAKIALKNLMRHLSTTYLCGRAFSNSIFKNIYKKN
jgi:hypothetical protein